jgi:hypothetical protein
VVRPRSREPRVSGDGQVVTGDNFAVDEFGMPFAAQAERDNVVGQKSGADAIVIAEVDVLGIRERESHVAVLLASMVRRYGLRFKRNKHNIVYAGQRMEVTGLVVGEDSAGLGRIKRSSIRALVHRCEIEAPNSPEHSIMERRAASLVGQYARLHPAQGQALRRRLVAIHSQRGA